MNEILKKLLESEFLTEETRAELTEAFNVAVESFRQQVREEVSAEVRVELTEEWTKAKDDFTTAIDVYLDTFLKEEFTELKDEINSFRDLEVEYAGKLAEERKTMANQLAEELDSLVDRLDEFLEIRINEELAELHEDIEVVKKNEFGRKVFESFSSEFAKHFKDPVANKSAQALSIAEDQISDLQKQIRALKEEKSSTERREVLESVLKPLSGIKREQMEILLSKVATDKLQEAYNSYIGRLLREDAAPTKAVVTESAPVAAPASNIVVTGDKQVNESTDDVAATALARAKRLAGICN